MSTLLHDTSSTMETTNFLVRGFTSVNEDQKLFNPRGSPAASCFSSNNKRKLSIQQDPAADTQERPQEPTHIKRRRRSPSTRPMFRPRPMHASPALTGQHPDQEGSQKTQQAAPAPRPRHPNQNVLLLQRGRMPIKTQELWIEDLKPALHRGQYRPGQFLLLSDDSLSGRIAAPDFCGVTWHATGKPAWCAVIYQLLARIPEHQATSANLYYLATEWIPDLDFPDPHTYSWGNYTHNCRASLTRSPEFEPVHPPKLRLHTIVAAPVAQAASAAPAATIALASQLLPANHNSEASLGYIPPFVQYRRLFVQKIQQDALSQIFQFFLDKENSLSIIFARLRLLLLWGEDFDFFCSWKLASGEGTKGGEAYVG